MSATLVVTGTVATFDDDRRVLEAGAVYINDGRIEAVRDATAPAPAGYTQAPRVHTGSVVHPGLIDLHNHLAYNFEPLWRAPRDGPYETRYQWPGASTYGPEVSNPAQAMGIAAPAAALRYAEVKAAVGGVTAIQGSPPLTRAFPGWMVRNIEKDDPLGTGTQRIDQSVLPATPEKLDGYATKLAGGRSFIYHLAEGTAPSLREEFALLRDHGCVQRGLVGIHSTALTAADFSAWGGVGGSVVWSPLSNLWLYGDTTDVLAARAAGLLLCLGSDWSPSGTRNVLGELKVADLWNRTALAGALTPLELCECVTRNPGEALELAWDVPTGRLVEGGLADLAATRRGDVDVYRSLVAATERDVRFVAVGGRPVYGNRSLLLAAGVDPADAEPITVAGIRRAIVMSLPGELLPDAPDLRAQATMSWADGLAALEAVRADPGGAVRAARVRERQRDVAEPELRYIPDMPLPSGPGARALDELELDTLVIAPLDGLAHDAGFFRRLRRLVPDHAAVLTGLEAYYLG